jgi:hypothetical protein
VIPEVEMLTLIRKGSAPPLPTWMVQVEARFADACRPAPDVDELEPMVELLHRTDGVCAALVAPRLAGLAVAMSLAAPDANAAIDRARPLVLACARYAALGQLTIERVQVVPGHGPTHGSGFPDGDAGPGRSSGTWRAGRR